MGNGLIRFLISVPGMLVVAFGFNHFNHRAYYTTIQSTQTVDFNILTHTLPTKLSQALLFADLQEIQRTVNSNYGLFGIVITNCKEEQRECNKQEIIAKSRPERKGWAEKQFPKTLLEHPYNILRSPAPTTAEWEFENARSIEVRPTGRTNRGKAIGRVYYIRRDPPNLIQSQIAWLLTPAKSLQILITTRDITQASRKLYEFVDSGASKYYFLTNLLGLVAGLFIWRTWERILYRRELQQKLYERREKELVARHDRYRRSSIILEEEVQSLQVGLSNKKKDEKKLKYELSNAREVLSQEEQKTQHLQDKLAESIEDSELTKEAIHLLTQQLELAREQTHEKWQAVSLLQQQSNSLTDDILNLKVSLNEVSIREKQYQRAIESLQQEKIYLEEENEKIGHSLGSDLGIYSALCEALDQDIRNLKNELRDTRRENYLLQEELNKFERCQIQEAPLSENNDVNFSSVSDALEAAARDFLVLEIWDSAKKAALGLNNYLPNRVYQNLAMLADVGELYFERKTDNNNLQNIFQNRGVDYCPRESTHVSPRNRSFSDGNRRKQMFRHLRVGRRLRIYFEFDRQERKVQIGYCGLHL